MNSPSSDDSPWESELLRKGEEFWNWKRMLEGTLVEHGSLGHVIYECRYCEPVLPPEKEPSESGDAFLIRWREFYQRDSQAFALILARLDNAYIADLELMHGLLLRKTLSTSRELYLAVLDIYMTTDRVDIQEAIATINSVKLIGSDTEKYIETFLQCVGKLQKAFEQYAYFNEWNTNELQLSDGLIRLLFVQGTLHQEWLRTWRSFNKPQNMTLGKLISSLERERPPYHSQRLGDNWCTACKSRGHSDANCFYLHPELRPEGWLSKKDWEKKKKRETRREKGKRS